MSSSVAVEPYRLIQCFINFAGINPYDVEVEIMKAVAYGKTDTMVAVTYPMNVAGWID